MMKYWWLEKYKNFKFIQMVELEKDLEYFLIMPKNYQKKYLNIKDNDIETLEEEDLLILLKIIITSKKINDSTLNKIINKLLTYPDNSFPASDYNFTEMLDEISKLYKNFPTADKLDNNNVCVCYHCLNVFYVDKIKNVNKMNICLCPYCGSNKLYFDNEYIPMNYSFIKLANMFYHISNLGCSFLELKKIVKKSIKIEEFDKNSNDYIDITDIFNSKLTPIDEKIISKKLYDKFSKYNDSLTREITVYIDDIKMGIPNKLILLFIVIIDFLSKSVYLQNITIKTNSKRVNDYLKSLIKTFISYKI